MRFALDVAFVDAMGIVRRIVKIPPNRVSRLCLGSTAVIEAEAGAFERWDLRVGDCIEVKE
jgi:uncharacterized membrane protein (UPF0127 family)